VLISLALAAALRPLLVDRLAGRGFLVRGLDPAVLVVLGVSDSYSF